MEPVTVYLVRHGQTYLNKYNRMQGWCDSPLTDKGEADADRAGKYLREIHFQRAYCSDTMRARNTAKHILAANLYPGTHLHLTENFREQCYGYFEGDDSARTWYVIGMPHGGLRTFHEIIKEHGMDASKDFMAAADPFGDAEDARTYWTRLMHGFKELRDDNPDGGDVLMVSHGTTIRSIVDKFGRQDGYDVSVSPKNGSVSKIQLTDDGIKVLSYNQVPKD
ncbi:histidine phosphatase family protein [Lacticaseibacillus pantheris]|uniref:Phosphoglycerate mutase n=1 Tax=Lacticaseibacillus pantheris DSM 15945 = JCM 12539 = NBRC 106106 TaxID=1423783 RepID=A0A0R1U7L1_9LACO|nr:histidine phosphatase family protein [Lacticaseibacillus pantheris]KRL85851.1 phosphoglycerate mutase [Lacticaseibacillus pantheris DSM 15945 = JCM 12539 = NBRC 106106]